MAYASERTANGKIVMAGESMQNCSYTISVLQMLDNGIIDSTFGVNGYVLLSPTPYQNTAYDIAIQQDGKIVLVGRSWGNAQSYFTIIRLTENGQLDNAFGTAGVKLIQSSGSLYDGAKAVSIQTDGKLVVSGIETVNGNEQFTVMRLYADGRMDNTFGANGKATYDVGANYIQDNCNNSIIQPDGKIIVVGASSPYGFRQNSILRLNTDGSLDLTFNGTGFKVFYISACNNELVDIFITADNKIFLAAQAYNLTEASSSIGLIQLLPDGNFDPSIGNGTGFSNPVEILGFEVKSMEITSRGEVVVVGNTYQSDRTLGRSMTAYRFFADGTLDRSYGQLGLVKKNTVQGPYSYPGSGVFCSALNEADELFMIGTSWAGEMTHNDFTCFKFSSSGFSLTRFGNNGSFMQALGSETEMQKKIVPFSDGSFLSLGKSIAKFNEDGSLDHTFSITSNTLFDPMDCVIQPDGKIVIAGGKKYNGVSDYDFAVLRLNPDGSPDITFADNGFFIYSFDGIKSFAYSAALQADGKIVVAGGGDISTNQGFIAIRLTTAGDLDSEFDSDGILVLKMNNNSCTKTVCIQPDGKILLGGYTRQYNYSGYYSAILRVKSNGSLDNTFGVNGIALRSFNGGSQTEVYKLTLQPDQKILAAGKAGNVNNMYPLLMRYNSNGSEDNSFNGDGKILLTEYVTYSAAFDVKIQEDGKILLLGTVNNAGNSLSDLFLQRFHSTGLIDNSFASGGKFYFASLSSAATSYFRSTSLDIHSNGKILLSHYNGCKLLLLRLLNDSNPQIKLSDIHKTYGDETFYAQLTTNSNGGVHYEVVAGNAITINAVTGEATIQKAGTAKIKITQSSSGSLSSGTAYSFVAIDPAVLTVTADDMYKIAGDENPQFTYTYSGFVYNDNAEVVSGAPNLMSPSNAASPAGMYPIVLVKNTLHANNYVFKLVEGKLIIGVATGIDANKINSEICVFPNPSAGKLYIKADVMIEEICITNVVGQQEFFYTAEFNTSMKGMVIVRIKTAEGFSYKKIVLE